MTLLPTLFLYHLSRLASMIGPEIEVSLPGLTTYVKPPRAAGPVLRIALDDQHHLSFENQPHSVADDREWEAAVVQLRAFKVRTAPGALCVLDIASDVSFQEIIDLLSALREAGFPEVIFADNPADK